MASTTTGHTRSSRCQGERQPSLTARDEEGQDIGGCEDGSILYWLEYSNDQMTYAHILYIQDRWQRDALTIL